MKMMLGVMILGCLSAAAAAETHNNAYPTGKLAEFVVEKMEVTSVPSAIRPKLARGKKTFGDYGYITEKVDEKEAIVKAPEGSSQIAISVLEESASGIYVCVNGREQNRGGDRIQRVMLLKLDNGNGLLKGREASKEFDGCPVIGGGGDISGD